MTEEEPKELSFEEALLKLENIVRELESGRIKLMMRSALMNKPSS